MPLQRLVRQSLPTLALSLSSVAFTQEYPVAPPSAAPLPVYDVISIHENKSSSGFISSGPMSMGARGADGYTATNVNVHTLVMNAYEVPPPYIISGLPAWADSIRFDVKAKITDPDIAVLKKLTPEQRRAMLIALLSDRFHLQAHFVSKTLPTYDLVIAKGGPKLKENATFASPDKMAQTPPERRPGSTRLSNSHMTAFGVPISNLAANLSSRVGRKIMIKPA